MLQAIISFLVGYLIGSFPTAYIFVKKKTKTDIRSQGSGNVGAMNVFDITGSKALSTSVMIVDVLKGVSAVLVIMMLFTENFLILASSGVGSIIGHNYPLWLRFKGGRGLATTAGVMFVMGWIFVAVWCTIWAILYLTMKNIHTSNVLATVGTPIVLFIVPNEYLLAILPRYETQDFLIFAVIVCTLILIRHMEFFKSIKATNTT